MKHGSSDLAAKAADHRSQGARTAAVPFLKSAINRLPFEKLDDSERNLVAEGVASFAKLGRVEAGRPPVGPKIQVRVDSELLNMIDAAAAERGISRAELVRQILAEFANDL